MPVPELLRPVFGEADADRAPVFRRRAPLEQPLPHQRLDLSRGGAAAQAGRVRERLERHALPLPAGQLPHMAQNPLLADGQLQKRLRLRGRPELNRPFTHETGDFEDQQPERPVAVFTLFHAIRSILFSDNKPYNISLPALFATPNYFIFQTFMVLKQPD